MSPISLNPATFVEGGLMDDVDVLFLDSRFTLYDYEGKSDKGAQPCLGLELQVLDASGAAEGKPVVQYYSAGDKKYFTPSADGSELIPVTDKQALNNQTNAAQFLASLIAAGFPVDRLETGKSTVLIGLKCHMNRIAQKKRAGLARPAAEGDREKSILLVSRIIALPAAGAGGGIARPLGVQTAPPIQQPHAISIPVSAPNPQVVAAGNNGDAAVDTLAQEVLIGILAENGGTITKKDMLTKAFQSTALQGNALKAQVVQRIYQDPFLMSMPGMIRFDGNNITMG